jgi:hypothetical protein
VWKCLICFVPINKCQKHVQIQYWLALKGAKHCFRRDLSSSTPSVVAREKETLCCYRFVLTVCLKCIKASPLYVPAGKYPFRLIDSCVEEASQYGAILKIGYGAHQEQVTCWCDAWLVVPCACFVRQNCGATLPTHVFVRMSPRPSTWFWKEHVFVSKPVWWKYWCFLIVCPNPISALQQTLYTTGRLLVVPVRRQYRGDRSVNPRNVFDAYKKGFSGWYHVNQDAFEYLAEAEPLSDWRWVEIRWFTSLSVSFCVLCSGNPAGCQLLKAEFLLPVSRWQWHQYQRYSRCSEGYWIGYGKTCMRRMRTDAVGIGGRVPFCIPSWAVEAKESVRSCVSVVLYSLNRRHLGPLSHLVRRSACRSANTNRNGSTWVNYVGFSRVGFSDI